MLILVPLTHTTGLQSGLSLGTAAGSKVSRLAAAVYAASILQCISHRRCKRLALLWQSCPELAFGFGDELTPFPFSLSLDRFDGSLQTGQGDPDCKK